MTRPVLFLDDGGVMNDNRLRGPQWQRLVAEFFVPRLGGTQEAWSEANRIVISRLLEPAAWARQAGARTVLIGTGPAAQEEAAVWSASLAELPAIMDGLE
jgi:hypothetical protein